MKDYRALRQQPPGQAVTEQAIPNVQWFPGHMKKAKDIIVNHGGRIWAHSEGLGKGASFNFTLPIANS